MIYDGELQRSLNWLRLDPRWLQYRNMFIIGRELGATLQNSVILAYLHLIETLKLFHISHVNCFWRY